MAADGSITAEVGLNISQANKQLAKLKQSIRKTEQEIDDLTKKRDAKKEKGIYDAATLDAEKEKLAQMRQELEEIRNISKDKSLHASVREEAKANLPAAQEAVKEQAERVRMLQSEWNKTENEVERYNNKIADAEEKLDRQIEEAGELEREIASTSHSAANLSGIFDAAESAVAGFIMASIYGAKKAAKAFYSLAKQVVSIVKNMNVLTKLSDKLGVVFRRLGSMIRRVFVYSVLTSFFRAIRKQITQYLSINSEFMVALGRLKSALYTAFQPIITTVIPMLTSLINVLTKVISVIAQFITALFGTTGKRAQANAKALNEQAKATEKAGNAAEKASQQLAGFDEINTLSFDDGSGSGGAGSADTGDALFDIDLDDKVFKTWGEAFDAFLDHIINEGIPKLRESLNNFAGWINWFSENLIEMFTFPGVYDKVVVIGDQIAQALNDAVMRINWNQLGKALGAGFDTAIAFVNSIFDKLDFLGLGKRLAEAVNGIVDMVNWHEFGRFLWAGFKSGLETLAGFIVGLNMPELAAAASDIAIGFFGAIRETIEKIPWYEIGAQVARFLKNIKWAEIFRSVYGVIMASLEAIRNILAGFLSEFGEWTQPIVNIVNTIFDAIERVIDLTIEWAKQIDLKPVATAFIYLATSVSNLVSTITNGLLWAYKNVLLPLAGWVIEEAAPVTINLLAAAIDLLSGALDTLSPVAKWVWGNILQPIGSFAWDIISTALEGITNTIKKLTDLLRGNTSFKEFIDSLSAGEAIVASLITVLGSAAAIFGVVSAAASSLSAIITALGIAIGVLTSPIGLVIAAITALVAGFTLLYQHSDSFRTFIDGIVEGAKELIPGIIDGIQQGWENFTAWLQGLWKAIVDGFKNFFGIHSPSTLMKELAIMLILGLLEGIKEMWDSIPSFFAEKANELKETLANYWEEMRASASEKWESIRATISEKWDNIKENVGTAAENVKTKIGEVWENTKQSTAQKWEEIKASLSEKWQNIKDTAVNVFNAMKTSVSEIFSGLWNSLKGTINGILGGVEKLANGVINGINSVIKALNGLKFTVPDWVPGMGGKSFGFNIKQLSTVSIPRLATGAVIPPNREFMAVLGDQKSGRNLEAPESLIRQIVREESGGGMCSEQLLSAIQTLNSLLEKGFAINVDGATFGRTAIRTINNVNAGAGRQLLNI